MERYTPRRQINEKERSHNTSDREADTVAVAKKPLNRLAAYLPSSHTPAKSNELGEIDETSIEAYYPPVKAEQFVPNATVPLIDLKRVRWGGGRIIGGGTSKEALRRAKKDERTKRVRQRIA